MPKRYPLPVYVDCFEAEGNRRWMMHKIASILSIALSLVLLAISSSHAIDYKTERFVLAKLSFQHDNVIRQNSLVTGKKAGFSSFAFTDSRRDKFAYNNFYNTESGPDKNSRTGEIQNSFLSYMPGRNITPSFVNNISFDFSKTGKNNSFDFSASDIIPSSFSDAVRMGAAFLTNLAVHEFGHEVVANYAGAEESSLSFFKQEDGQFFLGMSTAKNMDSKSILPYTMGGEFFADLTFEHALQDYRKNPGVYNKSLLLYSGTDFLWYCFYAFYVSQDNSAYDPLTISKQTGLSKDMLFSVALAKTLLNAYRVYSGQDRIVPYFTVDKYSAALNIMIPFEFGS
ncbi:MAG TPA: hypothetical protein ENG83_02615 [Nitrospirae bacterium]|nr:hypothetical protein [Nitrospirota bacterium]HDY99933.1 hypothetical protein [Nitrospirota bacterium]